MGLKEAILSVCQRLETIQTTTLDGLTGSMFVRIWNDQIERKKAGTGYTYQVPACFVETVFDGEQGPIGQGVNSYALTFRVILEQNNYNTEGTLDQNLDVFALRDKVSQVMNGFKPTNCSPLVVGAPTLDHSHDNTYLAVFEFKTTFTDFTGSLYDTSAGVYIEQGPTEDNWILQINTDLYPKPVGTAPEFLTNPALSSTSDLFKVGQPVTCSDGIYSGTAPIAVTYQWQVDGVDVGDDTNTYTPVSGDFNKELTCKVTITNGFGNDETLTDGQTIGMAPVPTQDPSISVPGGVPEIGVTLSCVAGVYTGTTPITKTYQWKLNGVVIDGQTGTTYKLTAGDLAGVITCVETATNIYGSAVRTTTGVTAVTKPSNTVAPSIAGNNYPTQVLTVTAGTYTGTEPITLSYQWYRGETVIVGATSTTYTLQTADQGLDISVVETATNSVGDLETESNSIFCIATEYQAILAENLLLSGTNPSTAVQRQHTLALLAAKSSGAWTDAGYVVCLQHDGSDSFSTINWINPTGAKSLAMYNGTRIANVGFPGNGTNAWIKSGYNSSTDTKATTTSLSFGVYTDDAFATPGILGGVIFGGVDAGGSRQFFISNSASTAIWSGMLASSTTRTTTSNVKTANAYGIAYDGTNVSIHIGDDVQTFAQGSGTAKVNQDIGVLARKTLASQDQYTCATVGWIIGGNATAFAKWKSVLNVYYPLIRPAKPTYNLIGRYDFSTLSSLFKNTAKTQNAAVGDPARVVENLATGSTYGDLVAASDASSATVLTTVINGLNACQLDGVNDNYPLPTPITGDFTAIFTFKNQDSANGSHIMHGVNYCPVTGSGYSGNASFGGEYITIHCQTGSVAGIKLKNQSNAWNTFCIARLGKQFWTVNGLGQQNNGTNATTFTWTNIGTEFLTNCQAYGPIAEILIYEGKAPDSIIEQKIFTQNTKFAT